MTEWGEKGARGNVCYRRWRAYTAHRFHSTVSVRLSNLSDAARSVKKLSRTLEMKFRAKVLAVLCMPCRVHAHVII